MDNNSTHTALNVLVRIKENLLDNMVDDLVRHQDDDPSSFSLQEIEDKFAIRIANLNTLIATIQDHMSQNGQGMSRIITNVEETTKENLDARVNELLEFISPDELLHVSVTPVTSEPSKFIIVVVYQEYSEE